jgi:hypothetical protein
MDNKYTKKEYKIDFFQKFDILKKDAASDGISFL